MMPANKSSGSKDNSLLPLRTLQTTKPRIFLKKNMEAGIRKAYLYGFVPFELAE
jgi:hypothetical protein